MEICDQAVMDSLVPSVWRNKSTWLDKLGTREGDGISRSHRGWEDPTPLSRVVVVFVFLLRLFCG